MSHLHLVTVEGSDHGPYATLGPAHLTGYDTLTVTFATARQISADLNEDPSGLSAQWHGHTLHFTATADYNGAAFSHTVAPNPAGHYVIPNMWPWEHWDDNREQSSAQRAYAHGATGHSLQDGAPLQDRRAWQRGRDESLALHAPSVQPMPPQPSLTRSRPARHR